MLAMGFVAGNNHREILRHTLETFIRNVFCTKECVRDLNDNTFGNKRPVRISEFSYAIVEGSFLMSHFQSCHYVEMPIKQ